MRPVRVVNGRMVPLDRADVDTDQIMPARHLKRIERTGYGELVFGDWRGDPGFVLNDRRYAGATVLVTGPNFGSGSSREHAPWGLQQYGFQAVVAPSFADIFRANCAKIGLLTVTVPAADCCRLLGVATADPGTVCTIDLPSQRLRAGDVDAGFTIDADTKRRLLVGMDDVAATLRLADAIAAFEGERPAWLPTTR
ncbi:MAG: 3-isopropylmalate dehydratase small subunit [Euzebyales bacterium]|nr:3-isopropylmalate dehydratase small subunit [Euzebyales bacterium]